MIGPGRSMVGVFCGGTILRNQRKKRKKRKSEKAKKRKSEIISKFGMPCNLDLISQNSKSNNFCKLI